MAEQLTPRTLDVEFRGSSLVRHVVSLYKVLYSTLSLFTHVYKYTGTGNILLGGNPVMD